MKKEWELLTLDGYLAEVQFPSGLARGTTFSRTLPETPTLPAVTVGLGLMREAVNSFVVDLVPAINHSRTVMINSFINEVAEQYLRLSEVVPDHWQEALLLDLGYVKKPNSNAFNTANNYTLFSPIPVEEKLPLLSKYGFHKIATIVSYGYTDDIEQILTTLDDLNKELPEEANYGTIMELLKVGVPVEDLHMAVQLPADMVAEIYGE